MGQDRSSGDVWSPAGLVSGLLLLACQPAPQISLLPQDQLPLTAASFAALIFEIWGKKALKGSGVSLWGPARTPFPAAFRTDAAMGAEAGVGQNGAVSALGRLFSPSCSAFRFSTSPQAQSTLRMAVWSQEGPRNLSF